MIFVFFISVLNFYQHNIIYLLYIKSTIQQLKSTVVPSLLLLYNTTNVSRIGILFDHILKYYSKIHLKNFPTCHRNCILLNYPQNKFYKVPIFFVVLDVVVIVLKYVFIFTVLTIFIIALLY